MNCSYFLFVFGTVIIQLSFIIPSSKCGIIDDLKKNITEQEKIQKQLKEEYDFLKTMYQQIKNEFENGITILIKEKTNVSNILDEKIQLGLDLYKILVQLRLERNELNLTLHNKEKLKLKLDYGIKWLEQKLDILEARNASHDDEICFMIINQTMSSTGRSLGGPKQDDPDEVFYYQHRLSQLLTQNSDLNLEIDQLNLVIKTNTELWEFELANLNIVIDSYLQDIETAIKDNEQIKKDIEAVEKEIITLKELIAAVEKAIEEDLKKLQVIKPKLEGFAVANWCYNLVEEEVLHFIPL